MNRRSFLAGAAAAALAAGVAGAALTARRPTGPVLRVGVMSNLTHAPLLAGLGSGRIARALAPVNVEVRVFRSGPRVAEAMLGDAIDVGTAGPAAVVLHHARHAHGRGGGMRVLGGCASGGASFVVRRDAHIEGAADLRGKRLAVTQIGTTQDVALRVYLRAHGLADRTAGGDVQVIAVAASTILDQMRKGDLDGAWLAEPWATRLVRELGARRLVDERDLWPARRFATAVLFSSAARADEPAILRLTHALEDEIARTLQDPGSSRAEAYAELERRVGRPGSRAIFDEAWKLVDFTPDPLRASIERFAEQAADIGLCPPRAAEGLFV